MNLNLDCRSRQQDGTFNIFLDCGLKYKMGQLNIFIGDSCFRSSHFPMVFQGVAYQTFPNAGFVTNKSCSRLRISNAQHLRRSSRL